MRCAGVSYVLESLDFRFQISGLGFQVSGLKSQVSRSRVSDSQSFGRDRRHRRA